MTHPSPLFHRLLWWLFLLPSFSGLSYASVEANRQCSVLFEEIVEVALYSQVLKFLDEPIDPYLQHESQQWISYVEKLKPMPWPLVRQIAQGETHPELLPLTNTQRAHLTWTYTRIQELRQNASGTNSDSSRPGHDLARSRWRAADEQVMKWISAGEPLTLARIDRLNWLLESTEAQSSDSALTQRYRTKPVYAGGRKSREYIDPQDVPRAMEDLMRWLHANEGRLHPIELAAQAYRRFVSIHPYRNGNGRTGRLIMDWILIRNGYPPPVLDREQIDVAVFGRLNRNLNPTTGSSVARIAEGVALTTQFLSSTPE